MDESERPNRRSVVSGLAIASGWWVAGVNIRPARAQAVRTSKPVLTPSSIAAMMTGPQRASFNAELASSNDFVAFLGRHFTMTDRQVQSLRSIPAVQLANMRERFSVGGLLSTSLASRAQQEAFLSRYLKREGTLDDFWSSLEDDRPSSTGLRRTPSIRPSLRIPPPASRSRRPPP